MLPEDRGEARAIAAGDERVLRTIDDADSNLGAVRVIGGPPATRRLRGNELRLPDSPARGLFERARRPVSVQSGEAFEAAARRFPATPTTPPTPRTASSAIARTNDRRPSSRSSVTGATRTSTQRTRSHRPGPVSSAGIPAQRLNGHAEVALEPDCIGDVPAIQTVPAQAITGHDASQRTADERSIERPLTASLARCG